MDISDNEQTNEFVNIDSKSIDTDVILDEPDMPANAPQQRHFRRLMIALLLVYWAYYWVRSPMSVTMPMIMSNQYLTNSDIGVVISAGYASQSVGKLLGGAVIDRMGGRPMLFGALAVSTASCILFGVYGYTNTAAGNAVSQSLALYAVLWSVNRIGQSAAWGAILKILSQWMDPKEYGSFLGLFALSYGMGDAINRLILGLLLKANTEWFVLWFLGGVIATIIAIASYPLVHETPKEAMNTKKSTVHAEELTGLTGQISKTAVLRVQPSLWQAMKPTLKSPRFWALMFMYVLMTMIRETFLSWVSVINAEVLKFDDSWSAIMSLIFPLFGCLSAIWGGRRLDKTAPNKQDLVAISFLCALLVSLTGLAAFVYYIPAGQPTVWIQSLGIFLLSLVAFSMEAPYTFIDGVYTLRLSGNAAPALTVGILQAAANAGAIAAGYLTGLVTENWGWATMVAIMAIQVFVVLISACMQYRRGI